ncbi:MAG: acetyl-CoA carboxylase biotin carboxylase subunit [Proteobacteria bacterium]|nr:acetyl-CoA carboxylase biotin carboxylase subunit [Pseudomonadota bacterium]
MFKKVLIANRGEIALRIVRTCREQGVGTVAIYSKADENALHVRFADEAICVGDAAPLASYLKQPNILSAAQVTGCDAVHPGYGFLAENTQFANAVRALGLAFIGPSSEHLLLFGDKLRAKEAATEAGLPLIPGSKGPVESVEQAMAAVDDIGFPVMLKAAAGGGGRGMRVLNDMKALERVFAVAEAEARAAFGSGALFVEKFLVRPRHIEVQVAGDGRGNGVHLGTRDCSLQRRHQKLVEEAPAPNISPYLRQKMEGHAAQLVQSLNYCTVGTVEFLVEGEEFYFLEVNPRIQVEHTVTEEVLGMDLIWEQMRLAAGEPLSIAQDQVVPRGHAIEVRVNAENPWTLRPSPGRITGYHEPGGLGIRVDSAAHEEAVVPPHYDSLIGKLIVRGENREHAIARLVGAIDEFIIEGIETTLPLQRELVQTDVFREGRMWTRFVDEWLAQRKV